MTDLTSSCASISPSLPSLGANHLYRALPARPSRGVIFTVFDSAGAANAWTGLVDIARVNSFGSR
jgi:hypothetical protein